MREYRYKQRLSQSEIAQNFGLNQQSYSNIETGRTQPSAAFIKTYLEFTGINLFEYMADDAKETIRQGHVMLPHPPASKQDELIAALKDTIESQRNHIAVLQETIAMLKDKLQQK